MVLYHVNGRVLQAHEHYVEEKAREDATDYKYFNQSDLCKPEKPSTSTAKVQIVIDRQTYRTLYCERGGDYGEDLESVQQARAYLTSDVDRKTLRICSTFAEEHFAYNPEDTKLHLPVRYPRQHRDGGKNVPIEEFDRNYASYSCQNGKRLAYPNDDQMAFIRPDEIEKYIIPWLKKVEEQLGDGKPPIVMDTPDALVDKIHLYNAMLQLGLPRFVQLPLIDALVLQMYQTRLDKCHLDTLEHTIGRFYSRGVAVLDPVLNHFIGTYSLRSLNDRTKPELSSHSANLAEDVDATDQEPAKEIPEEAAAESETIQVTDKRPADSTSDEVNNKKLDLALDACKKKRRYLEYYDFPAGRTEYPSDTYILPPELPVLGHSIRNWSSVHQNQSTAAASTDFPLNIGKYKKFIRRNSTAAINVEDYVEEETNRLAGQVVYLKHRPGKGD